MVELKNALLRSYRSVVRSIAFYPALIATALFGLALTMLLLEQRGSSDWLYERAPLLVIRDESTARAVVTTMVGGMISLMVFSFSMVMVLLNQASSSFSPRLLPGLISSKRHQVVLGMYLGTIIYGITMLINIHPKYKVYAVPGASIFLGVILTVVCLGLFIYFINTISKNIQVTHVLNQIFLKTRQSLLEERQREDRRRGMDQLPDTRNWHRVDGTRTGYLVNVAERQLVDLARAADTRIDLMVPLGGFTLGNLPVLASERNLPEETQKDLLSCLEFQLDRSVSDNYVHGFKQITEIALKAMSPGINDPGTAIDALDRLTGLLSHIMALPGHNVYRREDGGTVWLNHHAFTEVLSTVLQALRPYCRQDVLLMRRLFLLIFQLLATTAGKRELVEALHAEFVALREDLTTGIKNPVDRRRIGEEIARQARRLAHLTNATDFLLDPNMDKPGAQNK